MPAEAREPKNKGGRGEQAPAHPPRVAGLGVEGGALPVSSSCIARPVFSLPPVMVAEVSLRAGGLGGGGTMARLSERASNAGHC